MRIFWALVAMLVVGAGAMVAVDTSPSEPAAETSDDRTNRADASYAEDDVAMVPDAGTRGRSTPSEPSPEPGPSPSASLSAPKVPDEVAETIAQAPVAVEPDAGSELESIASEGGAEVEVGDIVSQAGPSAAMEDAAANLDGAQSAISADAEIAAAPSEDAPLSDDSDASASAPSVSPADLSTTAPNRAEEDDAGANGSALTTAPTPEPEADQASPSDTTSTVDPALAVGNEDTQREQDRADAASSVQRRGDGSYLVDGKHAITGQGTRDDPYRVGWDLLMSAEQTYNPRSGKEELPEWTEIVDGSWVRLDGYMLLPVMSQDVTELLLMRNQWDGCCIGVPPTAYDAVEVQLAERDKLSRLSVNHGTILGRFEVDPYLSGKWLIGLYMIKQAKLESAMGMGAQGQ